MRRVLALAILAALAGCASNEYTALPDPSGEWVPANPPSLTAAPPVPAAPPGKPIQLIQAQRRAAR